MLVLSSSSSPPTVRHLRSPLLWQTIWPRIFTLYRLWFILHYELALGLPIYPIYSKGNLCFLFPAPIVCCVLVLSCFSCCWVSLSPATASLSEMRLQQRFNGNCFVICGADGVAQAMRWKSRGMNVERIGLVLLTYLRCGLWFYHDAEMLMDGWQKLIWDWGFGEHKNYWIISSSFLWPFLVGK